MLDAGIFLMLIIPAAVCIAIGIIIMAATRNKDKRPLIGPVLVASGAVVCILAVVMGLSMRLFS